MTISLITACYNSATTIRTALESVLRQTWRDVEHIVVDGGSKDGTIEILREYAVVFGGRLRWVSERDRGMYDAINKGIRMATGDVVGILNADDVLAGDGVIERVAEAFGGRSSVRKYANSEVEQDEAGNGMQGTPRKGACAQEQLPDAIYGDIRFVANRLDAAVEELRKEETVRYYSARLWRPWMLQWGFMPPHPSVYIRRTCFGRLGDYALDYKIAADYALLIRFLRKAKLHARYLPLCFVDMRVGGMSTKNWRSNLVLNQEIVRGNREAGYVCCLPMLVPKYLFKVFEFVLPKIKRTFSREGA